MVKPLKSAARAATSPMRNYLNQHFEMLKHEIREQRPAARDDGVDDAWLRLDELQNQLAEISLHHARILAGLRDELREHLAATDRRLDELEGLIAKVADVVAAMTTAE